MTDLDPTGTDIPKAKTKTYDGSIGDLVKALLNSVIKESEKTYGDTPLDRIRNELKFNTGGDTLEGITALSSYMNARASERQAIAMESLAKTAARAAGRETINTDAQAIVDQRESKRDYLATTYSLPHETLLLLWSVRGMLVDASIKSLSRPDRFDPYRRVSTEDIAWSLRVTPEAIWDALPHTPSGAVDFNLLEEFDIMRYGGTDNKPDEWMFGG